MNERRASNLNASNLSQETQEEEELNLREFQTCNSLKWGGGYMKLSLSL